jgi:hypothetical protein
VAVLGLARGCAAARFGDVQGAASHAAAGCGTFHGAMFVLKKTIEKIFF